jgi:hypothetical protein
LNEQVHKHRCAVRQLIMWRKEWGLKVFRQYINKYKDKLGYQLLRDFEDQWTKGNRADEKGEWK